MFGITHDALTPKKLCDVDRACDDTYQLCSERGTEIHQKFLVAAGSRVLAVRRSDVVRKHHCHIWREDRSCGHECCVRMNWCAAGSRSKMRCTIHQFGRIFI